MLYPELLIHSVLNFNLLSTINYFYHYCYFLKISFSHCYKLIYRNVISCWFHFNHSLWEDCCKRILYYVWKNCLCK